MWHCLTRRCGPLRDTTVRSDGIWSDGGRCSINQDCVAICQTDKVAASCVALSAAAQHIGRRHRGHRGQQNLSLVDSTVLNLALMIEPWLLG